MTVWFNEKRDRWMYGFMLAGKRYSGYALELDGKTPVKSERAAEQAEARARSAAEIAPKLPRAADYTLSQAFDDLMPAWKRQDDWPNKKLYMREIVGHFGEARAMNTIGPAEIRAYVEFSLSQPKRVWCGGPKRDAADPATARFWKTGKGTRGPRTTNLYLNTLRLAVNHAATLRDPITGEPAVKSPPVIENLDAPKRRARPAPDAVLSFAIGNVPQHTREAIVLSLMFGFRKTEALSLEISNVDFEAGGVWLSAADVKDDEDAFCHGSEEAMAYLRELVDQADARGVKRLITWRRHRKDPKLQALEPWRGIASPKRAWGTVMDAIEEKFGRRWRWHDIRAAFITHVALTSGPVAAQALARHSRYETTQTYVDVADDVRKQAASRAAHRPALSSIAGSKT